jgi:hypothetical protein
MKIWKLVAVAMLAMAPATFGAVSLNMVNPVDGTDSIKVVGTTPFTVNVMLNVGAADLVTGVTFAVSTDVPGGLRLTDRAISNPVLTDTTTSLSTLVSSTNNLLNPKNGKDIGCGSADGTTPTAAGSQLLMTLTFTPQQVLPNPAHISIVGVGAANLGVWADPDFSTWGLPVTSITLTPEPASMLLLAAGAAFFARRRRA